MSNFRPVVDHVEFTAKVVRPGDRFGVRMLLRNEGTEPTEYPCEILVRFEHVGQGRGFGDRHTPRHPTDTWPAGGVITDGPHVYQVPDDAPEGTYELRVSVYEPYTLNAKPPRWTTVAAGITVSKSAAPCTADFTPQDEHEVTLRRNRLREGLRSAAVLETSAFRFALDPNTGAFSLEDRQTQVIWASNPFQPTFATLYLKGNDQAAHVAVDRFDDVLVTSDSLEMFFTPRVAEADVGLTVRFRVEVASPRSLRFSYTAESSGDWEVRAIRLLDHALWTTDADEGMAVIPHRLGVLMKPDGSPSQVHQFTNYTVHKEGYSMAFCGVVKQGSAVLVDWEDPNTRLEVLHTLVDEPVVGGADVIAPSLVLSKSSRAFTLHVLGRGGYVEIAKAYREVAERRGLVVPWHKKRQRNPGIDRLIGAADFKPFVLRRFAPNTFRNPTNEPVVKVPYTAGEVAQLAEHWHRKLGIDRALVVMAGWIHKGYDNQHPDILPAAPEIGGNEGVADAAERVKACGFLFGLHDNYQDIYPDAPSWTEEALVYLCDGAPMKGGVWYGGQAWHMVSNKALEFAKRPQNLPGVKSLFAPTSYFVDTTLASPLFESWPPNPQTKLQDLQWRRELLDLIREHFGVVGSEEGVEWAVPHADYFEGILSHKMRSPVDAPIVPLLPMVYGDCVQLLPHQADLLKTDRAKWVVDTILYGGLPLYGFGEHLYFKEAFASAQSNSGPDGAFARGDMGWADGLHPTDQFIKNTYEVVSYLNRAIADTPMTDHAMLVPDGSVQLTRFGDVEVVVNYGPKPYMHGETLLPQYGFIVQGPQFLAFHATRHAGVEYPDGALFTARSLDGRDLSASDAVRMFHGFGSPIIHLYGHTFTVEKEDVVSLAPRVAGGDL